MRVVAGKYRGKKLKDFEIPSTRPTSDNVKENVFNILGKKVLNSICLDLFSGTGGIGIEFISRGAKKVYFIDKNIKSISLIKKNLEGINEDFEIKKMESVEFLSKTNEKFDCIFIDPPYDSDLIEKSLNLIRERKLLNENAVVITECEFGIEKDDYFVFAKTYKYGRKIITILKNGEN